MTLTQTAALTKRGLVLGGILFLLFTFGASGYQYYLKYQQAHRKPPEPKADSLFGKLPLPPFPPSSLSSSNYSYSLDTITGGLPTDVPKLMKVYHVLELGTTLQAPDKARDLAQKLSFPSGPEQISDTQYRFTDNNGGQLLIDLNSGNFKFSRQASTSGVLQDNIIPDQAKIISDFKNYLGSKNLLNDSLKGGRAKVIYDKPSQTESTQAAVTVWPDNLDKIEVVTGNFDTGLINAVVTKAQPETSRYTLLDFIYWAPDLSSSSTYPLKTPDQALSDLKSGKATVVTEPTSPQVSITSVKIAYFESVTYFPYIEPVYVFEGDHFAALVPAIADNFLTQ